MSYLGDFAAGATVRIGFNTVAATGVPTALVSGAVAIRRDGADVTPSGGVTLSVGVDSNAGQNEVVVNLATDPTTFAAGHDYKAYLSAGTVAGASVVGIYLGEWSVANRSGASGSGGSGDFTLPTGTVGGTPTYPAPTTTGFTLIGVVNLGSAVTAAMLANRRILFKTGSLAGDITPGRASCTPVGSTLVVTFAAPLPAAPAAGDVAAVWSF